ncbi:hypothetical protein E0500_018950 [Streptomyces sp. KM273126]|uniref:hypothetical protein n=1 Tax=Streptomyces sp. KM273126 TaxID=2545247 RepID=UPI00103DFBA9|nr:hypothetical protein [Streptomyces sp. KM273126]MBA2809420.1 hypothetical protein [Streptomyces sp. KM273126]
MSTSPQPDEQFTEMTGDPVRARQLRKSLQTILDRSNDPALREMAGEVLSGRLSLRDAANVPAYGEAMRSGMQQGLRAYEAMSESERREAEEEGRRQLDAVRGELDEEARERSRSEGGSGNRPGKHSGRGWSL